MISTASIFKTWLVNACWQNYQHILSHVLKFLLTHWGQVMHICVNKITIIDSDNGLSPSRRQAIIWTNTGILLIGPLGTNFSEILIEIHTTSFKKLHLEMSSGKRRPFCLGLNVLIKKTIIGSLFEPMLVYCQVNPKEQIPKIFSLKTKHGNRKCIRKHRLPNGAHFVSASMC